MKADSPLWKVLGEPANKAEKVAFEQIRDLLPDDGIASAWANVSFTTANGKHAEVDLLLLTRAGLAVVELKSWHGTTTAQQVQWRQKIPSGQVRVHNNPVPLANQKSKWLRGLLMDAAPNAQARKAVPFVDFAVVMHAQDSTVNADPNVAPNIWALDGTNVAGLQSQLFTQFADRSPHRQAVDHTRARQIRTMIEAAGLKPMPKTRKVGDYVLDDKDPISVGPSWQDYDVTHPVTKVRRRVRVFDVPRGAGQADRQRVEALAVRELRLTTGLTHPGIVGPIDYVDSDQGPSLLFAVDDAVPLDQFLEDKSAALGLLERLELVRSLAEAIRYAHARHLVHRALSPAHVFVADADGSPRIVVRDWAAARRISDETSTMTLVSRGESDVAGLESHDTWMYLAPETVRNSPNASGFAQDVFGVGTVAHLVLTGRPPATTLNEFQQRLESESHWDPLAAVSDLPESVAALVRDATAFDPLHRTISIDALLSGLDATLDELTSPEDPEERVAAEDPLEAAKGQFIAERFEVTDRRGSGGTGVAFEVLDYEPTTPSPVPLILKVARDDAAGARLVVEAETLGMLDHPRIVRVVDGPLTIAERTALLLTDAGADTLGSTIQLDGKLTLTQLESFGQDLFEALLHLEQRGVFHRDIKPANLAIAPDPGNRKPRLNLFDFSLSREPLENTRSGSRPYLDPFLGAGRRRQYDRAAELYAAAVTLFEMATGKLPWWQSGDEAPSGETDSVVVERALFDETVAEPIAAFFSRALAPRAEKRFGNVTEMATAWSTIFTELDRDEQDAGEHAASDAKAAAAELDTLLADAGLSGRALSALARLDAPTVGRLLAVPPLQINNLRGLGEKYRREIQVRVREWRTRLSAPAPTEVRDDGATRIAVERRVDSLIPRATSANESTIAALRAMLGITPLSTDAGTDPWPTQGTLAKAAKVSRPRISQIIAESVQRWPRQRPGLQPVIADLTRAIDERSGVATLGELTASVLVHYGSTLSGEERLARARGLIRAAVELDSAATEPRLTYRRATTDGAPVLIATTSAASDTSDPISAARSLGAAVDAALAAEPLVTAAVIRQRLRAEVPAASVIPDARLVELAAAASSTGLVSSYGDVYRRNIDGALAAEVVLRGVGRDTLTPDNIHHRVRQRFPGVGALPTRPSLDEIVGRTHPHLSWQKDRYALRDTSRASHTQSKSVTSVASLPAADIAERLRASLASHSWLVLTAHPRSYDAAAAALTRQYNLRRIDLAAELVAKTHATADAKNVSWEIALRADAATPDSADFGRLTQLIGMAMRPFLAELAQSGEPLLLTNAAPLARYGLLNELESWSDLATTRPAARWLLVDHPPARAVPDLDGHAIPFGADRWVALPNSLTDVLPSLPGVVA